MKFEQKILKTITKWEDSECELKYFCSQVLALNKMSYDNGNEVDNQLDEDDRPFLRDRVYYAAKDGLPIALCALFGNVKDEDTKNAIINQVRWIDNSVEGDFVVSSLTFLAFFVIQNTLLGLVKS